MSKSLTQSNNTSPFDAIRQFDNSGREFWSARDLQELLKYTRWEKFEETIDRAKAACTNSGQDPEINFHPEVKPTITGRGRRQGAKDYLLTRYACYLVAMNGDPRKKEIAAAQTYFAVKTREAEISKPRVQPSAIPFNKDVQTRCIANEKLLPSGYWCCVNEMYSQALIVVAFQKELKDWALPDGSCGRKWREYCANAGIDITDSFKHPLWVPNLKKPTGVWIYPYSLLEPFRNWLRVEYAGYYITSYSPSRVIGASICSAPKKKRLR